MESMIERVARAIAIDTENGDIALWPQFTSTARAAIEAMSDEDLKSLLTSRIFDSKTEISADGCLIWKGPKDKRDGYGRFYDGKGKTIGAHQYSFRREYGDVPSGLVIDHKCRNRACVMPAHLQAISAVENVMIGDGISARNAAKRFCVNGHSLLDENLYVRPDGNRGCRECIKAAGRRFRKKKKDSRKSMIDAALKEE